MDRQGLVLKMQSGQQISEIDSSEEFHGDEHGAIEFVQLEDLNDVGVIELRGDIGLVIEHLRRPDPRHRSRIAGNAFQVRDVVAVLGPRDQVVRYPEVDVGVLVAAVADDRGRSPSRTLKGSGTKCSAVKVGRQW